MLIWIIFAVLTAIVMTVLLWPAFAKGPGSVSRAAYDISVYQDQLKELERDEASGLIKPDDAAAARNELSRRMLEAQKTDAKAKAYSAERVRKLAMVAATGIPLLAMGVYLNTGRPDLPDLPRKERLANAIKNNDTAALIARAEAHLAKNPSDVQGWLALAVTYRRLRQFDKSARNFKRAIRLSKPDARLLTEYAEMEVLSKRGMVNADARKAFDDALGLTQKELAELQLRHAAAKQKNDKVVSEKLETEIVSARTSHAKVRFYLALADSQEGKKEEALAAFRSILADAPANAPWRAAVNRQIARLEPAGSAPKLDSDTIKQAEGMTPQQRQEMIRGMVSRLSERLSEEGGNLDEWLRLANARSVLGEKEKAKAALENAEKQFKNDAAAMERIKQARTRLGL